MKSPTEVELLFSACHRVDRRAVLDLLLEGLSVDAQDQHGQTMLMMAAQRGSLELATFLLEQGADVNARDAFSRSCLHHASSSDASIVRLLVKSGANIRSATERGHTPLHFACRCTNLAVMEALVELGADVHAVTSKGDTTIHQAVRSIDYTHWMVRMPEAVECLIKAGVDRTICNTEGYTALQLVERWSIRFAEDRQRARTLQQVRSLL